MALNQSQTQLLASLRKFTNQQGTTALLRHPDADLKDYINRALGALHRRLTAALPDQRFLASATLSITADISTYNLESDFDSLVSAELVRSGLRCWLQAYEMSERPLLADASTTHGTPLAYRLRGETIEFLPIPDGDYSCLLWYLPTTTQLTSGSDSFDTISRLDEFVIAYAARPIAIKDKNWDLVSACKGIIEELSAEIESLARSRDRNSPPRIVDQFAGSDRWGRSRRSYR